MGADRLYQTDRAEVWLGSCLEPDSVEQVMGERKADLICLDAPYSEKTHAGHAGTGLEEEGARRYRATHHEGQRVPKAVRRDLSYPSWSTADVARFVDLWVPRCNGWLVSITDDVLAPAWKSALEQADRYAFAPLPLVETGSRIRLSGDGPSSWTCWIVVARPKSLAFAQWGTLPGAYVQPREFTASDSFERGRVVGGKPLSAMLRIIGDYSRRGGLVVDPTCGGGTTLKAALMSGRRAIGMDSMREHAELTVRNIRSAKEQGSLFERTA